MREDGRYLPRYGTKEELCPLAAAVNGNYSNELVNSSCNVMVSLF